MQNICDMGEETKGPAPFTSKGCGIICKYLECFFTEGFIIFFKYFY